MCPMSYVVQLLLCPHRRRGPTFQRQTHRLIRLPCTSCKVREIHNLKSLRNTGFAEDTRCAPGCSVIDILIERQAIAEAVDETPVHDEVHTTVSSNLLCHLANVFYNGGDRKSTRLNSSHVKISYAVF